MTTGEVQLESGVTGVDLVLRDTGFGETAVIARVNYQGSRVVSGPATVTVLREHAAPAIEEVKETVRAITAAWDKAEFEAKLAAQPEGRGSAEGSDGIGGWAPVEPDEHTQERIDHDLARDELLVPEVAMRLYELTQRGFAVGVEDKPGEFARVHVFTDAEPSGRKEYRAPELADALASALEATPAF